MAHSMDVVINFKSNYAEVFGTINKGLSRIKDGEDKLKDYKPLGDIGSALEPLNNINSNLDYFITKQKDADKEAKKFKWGDFGGKVANPFISFFKGTIGEATKYKDAMDKAKKAGKSAQEINNLKISNKSLGEIDTFSKKMGKFNDAFKKAKIIIASDVMPVLDRFLDAGTKIINWFNNLNPGIQKSIVEVGLGIAATGKGIQLFSSAKSKVSDFFGMFKKAKQAEDAGKAVKEAADGVEKGTGFMRNSQKALCDKSKRTSRSVRNSFQQLKEGMSGILSRASESIKSCVGKIKSFGEVLKGLMTPGNIAVLVIIAIAVAAYLIITHWKQISAFFKKLWGDILKIFNDVKGALNSFWNSVKSIAASIFKGIASFFAKVFNTVKATVNSFWNWLKGFMVKWGPVILAVIAPFIGIPLLIAQHWKTIKAFLISMWNSIKSTAASIFKGLVSFFTSVWSEIVNIFKNVGKMLINTVSKNFTGIITGVKQVFSGIKTYFTGVWQLIKTIFLGAILLIIDVVTGKFGMLKSDIALIFTDLKKAFSNIWNGIKQIFIGVITIIVSAVKGYFTTMKNVITTIIKGVEKFFVAAWNSIKNTVINIVKGLVAGIKNTFNAVVSFFTSVWNGIKKIFIGTVTTIVSAVKGYFTTMKNVISTIIKSVENFFVAAWNSIKNTVINIVKGLVTGIKNTFNAVVSFFKGLPNTLKTLGVNMFTSLKNGIGSVLSTIGTFVQKGFTNAINFITSLPGKALQWGKDFIQGLIDGIKGAIGGVEKTVEGIANKIRSFLHFSVPDVGPLTDYQSWMPDFMQGLSHGIKVNTHLVTEPVKNVAKGIKGNMAALSGTETKKKLIDHKKPGSASGSSKSSKTNNAPQINIYMQGTVVRKESDIDKIADALVRKLRTAGYNAV